MFIRPNAHRSLLSPGGLKLLSLCLTIAGVTVAAIGLVLGKYLLLAAALGLILLGSASLIAGRAASRRQSLSPVFPPETSLLQLKGFLPMGFVSGVEILNDNLTPMAFVVSVLQRNLGISESDAIRFMLEFHKKGGLLLPMPSFQEATRVAGAVSMESRNQNHPLICRAVNFNDRTAAL
jgi:ATP-dependent Clp protease adapter protein ClpS